MKRNPYYQLRYMADIPYLVTFGQGHADFLRDIQLNETGVFLWEHLEEADSPEQLAELCLEHFHCAPEQYEPAKRDICAFVEELITRGIVQAGPKEPVCPFSERILEIGGLSCHIHAPAYILSGELLSFESQDYKNAPACGQHIFMITTPASPISNGQVIIRTEELIILESGTEFILLFTSFSTVKEAHLSKDGRRAFVYCTTSSEGNGAEEFSYAVRSIYFYLALHRGIVALHSASILYEDKLWLFSAASGVGKSTHAELWRKLFCTRIINGDINLVTLQGGKPVVCGNPWHGTSNIFNTCTFPLGGIILLKQGQEDNITPLSDSQKELFLLHRSISPLWTADLMDRNHELLKELASTVLVTGLSCTLNDEAALCCKNAIDDYLAKN